jgi:tetratricopeptide (TPR) repeat protein
MDLNDQAVALYGRFTAGVRDRLQQAVERQGGRVVRDLTRSSAVLVVGAQASALIDSGALPQRLNLARERGVPVFGERAFQAALVAEPPEPATLPLQTALGQTGLTREDAEILSAFDLIVLDKEACRFADAGVLRTTGELIGQGRSRGEVVRILARARDLSPEGRHKVVLTGFGEAALKWEDGLTSLEGQGILPLDEDHAGIEDLFEAAALLEASGQPEQAARLYDMCARADRSDAIAPYNLGNIRLGQQDWDQAVLAYQRALARDRNFVEARYNLAQALEACGKSEAAAHELGRVLESDPEHSDALFNLAQLTLKGGQMGQAKALYERYLTLDPPADWAATARKAILYCAARLSA